MTDFPIDPNAAPLGFTVNPQTGTGVATGGNTPRAMQADCDHHFEYRILGGQPISVGICTLCRDPDWGDLQQQAVELYRWGWSEGRAGKPAREVLSAYDKPREAPDGGEAGRNAPGGAEAASGGSGDVRALGDADLLAWAVVLGHRARQQRAGLQYLLMPFPPCPTCRAEVHTVNLRSLDRSLDRKQALTLQPCGHTRIANDRDMDRIRGHVDAMMDRLEQADTSRDPHVRGWTTGDVIREAKTRVGQPEQSARTTLDNPPSWQPDETLDYGHLPPPAADPNAPLRTGNSLPPADDDGPSVQEAAAADRRWPLQKAGE